MGGVFGVEFTAWCLGVQKGLLISMNESVKTAGVLMVGVVSINEPATCWILVWGVLFLVFQVVEVALINKPAASPALVL